MQAISARLNCMLCIMHLSFRAPMCRSYALTTKGVCWTILRGFWPILRNLKEHLWHAKRPWSWYEMVGEVRRRVLKAPLPEPTTLPYLSRWTLMVWAEKGFLSPQQEDHCGTFSNGTEVNALGRWKNVDRKRFPGFDSSYPRAKS